MMEIDKVLDSIQTESLRFVKTEFKQLLETAKKDNSKFIRESAEELQEALIHLSKNELSAEDVSTLLKKQKTLAELEANKARIEMATRIRQITLRLFDLAINVLVTAIPGMGIPAIVVKKLLPKS